MRKLVWSLVLLFMAFSGFAQDGLTVDAFAPEFSGKDQSGKQVSLSQLKEKGKVVLIFYRGAWCPHCERHLSHIQDSLQMILDKGANVVFISPELPESSEKIISKTGATFSILSDIDYSIMEAYEVAFKISKETVPSYYSFVESKTAKANGNDEGILPVPATFIIDQQGKIVYRQFDKNYKNRSSVGDILSHL